MDIGISRKLRALVLPTFLLVLSGCSLFAPEHKEVKKPTPPKPYEMGEYVKDLWAAHIMLNTGADAQAVKKQLATIKGFSAEKRTGPVFQTAVVMSYTTGNKKEVQYLAAPFDVSQNNAVFNDLNTAISMLQEQKYTVHDVHPVVLSSLPPARLKLAAKDPRMLKTVVDQEFKSLLARKTTLAPLNEARVQLYLLQFFREHKMRDAAYLAASNATQSLAAVNENQDTAEAIKNLSDKISEEEARLHKEMPFTLRF